MLAHGDGEMTRVRPRGAELDHVAARDHGVPLARHAVAIRTLEVAAEVLSRNGADAPGDAGAGAAVAGAEHQHVSGDVVVDEQRSGLETGDEGGAAHLDDRGIAQIRMPSCAAISSAVGPST